MGGESEEAIMSMYKVNGYDSGNVKGSIGKCVNHVVKIEEKGIKYYGTSYRFRECIFCNQLVSVKIEVLKDE